jgi:uncharacterized ferritin-like protein (DUF455 family)
MTPDEFIAELDASNQAVLDRMKEMDDANAAAGADGPPIAAMLRAALKNELEATELAARWMPSTEQLDLKLALARQVGDESRHLALLADRLRALGHDPYDPDPLSLPWSPLFQYLEGLTDPVERIAAAHFTREGIALVKNLQFAALCEERGDAETAELYRETINADEQHHHNLGRGLLKRYAVDEASQERARTAAARTLELAEETQAAAFAKKGVARGPGC